MVTQTVVLMTTMIMFGPPQDQRTKLFGSEEQIDCPMTILVSRRDHLAIWFDLPSRWKRYARWRVSEWLSEWLSE
jgi:hypothetical protein